MAYIESLKGYIIDVPELFLERNDGERFHFDKITTSNVTPDTQFMDISAGWSLLPVAYLPGQSTLEMTFESAQFDADLFALATNQTFEKKTVTVTDFFEVEVKADKTATIETPYAVKGTGAAAGTVVNINGLKVAAGDTPAAGEFTVGDSTGGESGASFKTVITFVDDLAGKTISVYVDREVEADTITVDNQQTFVGNALLKWPVYSSGDEEGLSAGGVKGYLYQKIFKARCTAQPGMDTSYKTNATPGITVAAMDPHRADGGIYQYFYVEK